MSNSCALAGCCAACGTFNEYQHFICNACGQRLPWADALEAATQEAFERGRSDGVSKYRAVFEATLDGLIVCTLDGFVAELNNAMCVMHGFTRAESIGAPVSKFIAPGYEYTFRQAVENITADPHFVYRQTLRDQRADGSTFPIEVTATLFQFRGETHILGVIRDVTETRRIEDALRRQLAITEAITQNAAEALFLMDAEGHATYLNPAAESTFGWTQEEMRGRTLHDVLHYQRPDGSPHPITECPLGKVFENGQVLRDHEDVFWHRNGQMVPVSCSNAPILRDGKIQGAVLVVHDITERKHAEALRQRVEQELQVTEERLRLATEATHIGTWDLNLLSGEMTWSPRCKEIFGLAPDDAIDYPKFLSLLHPLDRDTVAHIVEQSTSPQGNGEYEAEYRVVLPDGIVRWVAARGKAFFETWEGQRRAVRFIGTATDIDARKRAIDALRLLSAASATLTSSFDYADTLQRLTELPIPDYADFCIVDLMGDDEQTITDTFVAHVEPAKAELMKEMRRLVGFVPHHATGKTGTSGRSEPELCHQMSQELFEQYVTDPRAREIARILAVESYMVLPLKARGRILGTLTFCSSHNGLRYSNEDVPFAAELAERVAYAVDNARLFHEAEMSRRVAEAAQRVAEEANRAKDEFLATLSHELRTPLNAILGWSSLLNAGDLDDVMARRASEVIERNVRVQAQLLNDLFDVSRIITGKLGLEAKPMELLPVLQAALDSVEASTQAKSLRVEVLAEPEPLWVMGDATRLQQVLWNLLSNAVRFTPQGGRIQMRLWRVNDEAYIEVRDSGQGIKAEFLPYVFDRFRQADSSSTRRHGGLGLGLAIVRHLVEMHGGTVQAESAGDGQGALFRVRLPLLVQVMAHPDNLSAPDVFIEAPEPSLQDVPPEILKGLQILVVDDEYDSRELTRDVLQRYGAQVQTLASAHGALEILGSGGYDVLISDIAMPEEDGYALLQKVRAAQANNIAKIPAIALTALARASDRHAALSAGFQEHLTKPVEPVTLAVTVASLMGRL